MPLIGHFEGKKREGKPCVCTGLPIGVGAFVLGRSYWTVDRQRALAFVRSIPVKASEPTRDCQHRPTQFDGDVAYKAARDGQAPLGLDGWWALVVGNIKELDKEWLRKR